MSNQQWDEEWANTKARESVDSEEPPDGRYRVFVEKAEMRCSKNGNDYLSWQLRILDGQPHAGRCLFHRNMILSGEALSWLKRDLETCGMTLFRLSDLWERSTLQRLLDAELVVQKITKGEYVNIYLEEGAGTWGAVAKLVLEPEPEPEPAPVQARRPSAPAPGRAREALPRRAARPPAPRNDDGDPGFQEDEIPF